MGGMILPLVLLLLPPSLSISCVSLFLAASWLVVHFLCPLHMMSWMCPLCLLCIVWKRGFLSTALFPPTFPHFPWPPFPVDFIVVVGVVEVVAVVQLIFWLPPLSCTCCGPNIWFKVFCTLEGTHDEWNDPTLGAAFPFDRHVHSSSSDWISASTSLTAHCCSFSFCRISSPCWGAGSSSSSFTCLWHSGLCLVLALLLEWVMLSLTFCFSLSNFVWSCLYFSGLASCMILLTISDPSGTFSGMSFLDSLWPIQGTFLNYLPPCPLTSLVVPYLWFSPGSFAVLLPNLSQRECLGCLKTLTAPHRPHLHSQESLLHVSFLEFFQLIFYLSYCNINKVFQNLDYRVLDFFYLWDHPPNASLCLYLE